MFEGFSDKTVDLFWGIRFNNNREWFSQHKQEFQNSVMTPVKQLAYELLDWFSETYPKRNLNVHISRIYRDARRLFGKGPLKENIWFSFQSAVEKRDEAPCFWFEIGADGYKYGCGWWMKAADARRYRKLIDENEKEFLKRIKPIEKSEVFSVKSPVYAKSKGHAGDALQDWYNMRMIDVCCEKQYDLLCYSAELVSALKDGYAQLMPFFEFMEKVYHAVD